MDPHYFGKLDPDLDPHKSEKMDEEPHQKQNLEVVGLKMEPWRAVDAYNRGMGLKKGSVEDQWSQAGITLTRRRVRIPH